jgi:hypothetical protein
LYSLGWAPVTTKTGGVACVLAIGSSSVLSWDDATGVPFGTTAKARVQTGKENDDCSTKTKALAGRRRRRGL